jgi:hypothetical protein
MPCFLLSLPLSLSLSLSLVHSHSHSHLHSLSTLDLATACNLSYLSIALCFLRCPPLAPAPTDEVCHVFGPVDDNGSVLDAFGLAADSRGRLVFTCLANRTVARFDATKMGGEQVLRERVSMKGS